MSRTIICSLLAAMTALTSSGCPDSAGTPPDDSQLAPIAGAVKARYTALEITDERRAPSLYAFGSKITKLTPVFDAAGRLVFDAPGGWLYWSDLMPTSRLHHEGLLIAVADDGTVLKVAPTQLPPALVGDTPWALAQPTDRQAALKRAGPAGLDVPLTETEATAVLAITIPAPEEPSVPGAGCTPKRVLIAVAGDTYGDSVAAAGLTSDIAAISAWAKLGAVGVLAANVHVVQSADAGSLSRAALDTAMADADIQCCDEVVFYFTGHSHPERGLVLAEERLITAGIDQGAVESPGDYLDATGLFEVVGTSLARSWFIILETSHADAVGEAFVLATNTSNTASGNANRVRVISASFAGEPAHQLRDGTGLLTSLLVSRTSTDLAGPQMTLDAVAGEVDSAFFPAGVIGGKLTPDGGHWAAFATGSDKVFGQHPVYRASVDDPSGCECQTSADCTQPNSATCREAICRAGTCVEEVKVDGTLCGLQSECNAPACDGGVCLVNPKNDGLACEDGDNCTVDDTCDQAGFCVGFSVGCDDGNICTDDGCDATGACAQTFNTAACNDGIACTVDDACADGACAPGTPNHGACQALLDPAQAACTQGTCGGAGCSFAPLPAGPCVVDGVQGRCLPSAAASVAGATGTLGTCTSSDPHAQACTTAADCQGAIDAAAALQPELAAACLQATCVADLCVIASASAGVACDLGNSCSTYACDGAGACQWAAPATPLPAECSCDPALPIDGQCGGLKTAFANAGPCAAFHCFGSDPDGFCHVVTAAIDTACDPGPTLCWTGVCGADLSCKPRAGLAADLTAKVAVCDDASDCTSDTCVGPGQIGSDAAGCSHNCAAEGSECPTDATLVCGYDASAGSCGCVSPGDSCLCPEVPTPCQQQTCDDGSCLVIDLPDGTSCVPDPTDQCTQGTCEAGACIDGAAKDCDDGDECTVDSCDVANGACWFNPMVCPLDGAMDPQCQAAVCDAGACEAAVAMPGALCVAGCGSPGTCSAAGQCEGYVGEDVWCVGACAVCEVGVCDVGTGACGCTAAAEGAVCAGGTCAAGACVPDQCTVDGDCDDSEGCTADTCVAGSCDFAPLTGGTCDDGDVCTGTDVCAAGLCGGTAVVGCCNLDAECDDTDPCTADACAANVCANTDNGTCECKVDGDCDDINVCTGDTCVAGSCVLAPLTGGSCDDANACTATDVCAAGVCGGTAVAGCCTGDGECDDTDTCTDDTCVSNVCQNVDNGTCGCTLASECGDGKACTIDDCVSNSCTNVPDTGASCDDGDACTGTDLCDGAGACVGTAIPTCCTQPSDCDDSETCTVDDCVSNVCSNVPDTGASCDDGDPCTDTDLCNGAGACAGTANPTCCTQPSDCDDTDDCTADDCVSNACTHMAVGDGGACDDGDPCTAEDCQGGACTQQAKGYTVAAAGAVLPDLAYGTPATPMPDYLDYTGMTLLSDGAAVEVTFSMVGAIPTPASDTYAAGASTFAEITLVFFESTLPGDPGTTYSALTGATHMLTGRNEGAAWQGQLWLWNNTSGMWELDAAVVTATMNAAVATISATLPNVTTCTPFKGLTQLRRDPGAAEELVWKMFTTAGTDPTGDPVDPAL